MWIIIFELSFFFFWVLKALNTNRMLENGHVFPHQVTIDFTTINADTFKMLSISTEPKNTKKKPFQSFEVLKMLPYINTTKWSYVIKKRQITNYHFQHMECSRQSEIISNNPVLIWQKGSRSKISLLLLVLFIVLFLFFVPFLVPILLVLVLFFLLFLVLLLLFLGIFLFFRLRILKDMPFDDGTSRVF